LTNTAGRGYGAEAIATLGLPPHVAVLAPPFLVSAGLLVVSGASKLRNPEPGSQALAAANLPHRWTVVRALGAVEIAAGVTAAMWPVALSAAAVAVLYVAFALYLTGRLRSNEPKAPCGCFGAAEVAPSAFHVALNVVAAGVAVAVAVGFGPLPGLPRLLSSLGWEAVPFVLGTSAAAAFTALAVRYTPTLFSSYVRPHDAHREAS
jgi:hypothetical protein